MSSIGQINQFLEYKARRSMIQIDNTEYLRALFSYYTINVNCDIITKRLIRKGLMGMYNMPTNFDLID